MSKTLPMRRIIYENMRRGMDGKVSGSVRMKDGRMEAIITGWGEIVVGQDGDEFTFEFETVHATTDIPVRFRLIRQRQEPV